MHGVAPVPVEVCLLWRRDDEPIQPGFGEERAHRMQPGSAVGPHRAEKRQADPEVVQQLGSLAGQFRLLALKVAPRDHVELGWQI